MNPGEFALDQIESFHRIRFFSFCFLSRKRKEKVSFEIFVAQAKRAVK